MDQFEEAVRYALDPSADAGIKTQVSTHTDPFLLYIVLNMSFYILCS